MERIKQYIMSVKFEESVMNEMESILSNFLSGHDVKLTVPVDVFRVASTLGFDVRGSEFRDKLEGLIIVNEAVKKIDGFNSNKIIAYDCTQDINAKKFIVGHELAHYIEKKHGSPDAKIVLAARDRQTFYSDNVEEQRKDYISAALLIPKEDLLSRYPKESVMDSDDFYNEVAEAYNVNVKLAERRVKEVYNI